MGVLPWEVIKNIRNEKGRLYPMDWNKVCKRLQEKYGWDIADKYDLDSKEDFEKKLKEVCDSLYDWKLYEQCPKCGKGLRIPVWNFTQWTAFCGCSEYPKCIFSDPIDIYVSHLDNYNLSTEPQFSLADEECIKKL